MPDVQESQQTQKSSSSAPMQVSSLNIRPFLDISPDALVIANQAGTIVITIQEETPTQTVCLSVQDRGIGIPKRQQAQIFGRFMRAENAQTWWISGTELGLYLSRELVEWHGGRLWFDSEEDAGSTFFVTLPLVSAHQDDCDVTS